MKNLSTLVMLALAVGLTACGKKAENPGATEVSAPAPAVVAPTVDEAIVAVLRGHPNSRKICYDTNYDGYFMYYGPHLPPAAEEDGKFHGWYLVQKIQFYQAANKSWFIGLQPNQNYITVYPDVTGLPCKDQS
jgi:hypothetical protein